MIYPTDMGIPPEGDRLIFIDGRRFVFMTVELGPHGWWFTAKAEDGHTTLSGNFTLRYVGSHTWKPESWK